MVTILLKVWRIIEQDVILNIATVFFMISFGWMLLEALSRQLLSYSFPISEEIVVYGLMWAALLSIAQGGRAGVHIRIDLIVGYLPKSWQKGLSVVTLSLSFLYCLIILGSSFQVIPHLKAIGLVSYSPLEWPMWMVTLCISIGSFLLCLFYLECAIKEILSLRERGKG